MTRVSVLRYDIASVPGLNIKSQAEGNRRSARRAYARRSDGSRDQRYRFRERTPNNPALNLLISLRQVGKGPTCISATDGCFRKASAMWELMPDHALTFAGSSIVR